MVNMDHFPEVGKKAGDGERPRKRRLNAYGRVMRRERIFARMRDGWSYDEIAREEEVTAERIRQIVSEALRKRVVDTAADHARLQLARLERVMAHAGEALAQGDLRAGALYLRTIDRLDRYQKTAAVIERDEEEIRERLLAKLNAAAKRLGYDRILAENQRIIAAFEEKRRALTEANAGFPPTEEELHRAFWAEAADVFSFGSPTTP